MANETLREFLTRVRAKPPVQDVSEEAIKVNVILPVLDRLGWNWSDPEEVAPEYRVEQRRVDFCLRANTSCVFLEAKRPSEDLENDAHQRQLLEYAFSEGVDLAVLTNGIAWWLYLPTASGSWTQRKFFAIDIMQQEADKAADNFERFLGRTAVSNGEALRAAREVLDVAKRQSVFKQTLPLAWARLATEPDELLVDLIAEAVESQCGYRPDASVVAEFLAQLQEPSGPTPVTRPLPRVVPSQPQQATNVLRASYTGTIPSQFTAFGQTRSVKTWKEVLIGLAVIIYEKHPDTFGKVLALRGRKRVYFAREAELLFEPAPAGDSGYFAETNLSANDIIRRCRELLTLFEYPESDFSIEAT